MSVEKATQYQFVSLVTISGLVIGKMHKSEISSWKATNKVPHVLSPKALIVGPLRTGGQGISLVPIFPLRSAQKTIAIVPVMLEVIGNISEIDGTEICREDASLFDTYKASVAHTDAERSGIIAPTAGEVAGITKG